MKMVGQAKLSRGVSEQQFDLSCQGRRVPGIVWQPDSGDCSALVLLGHGGGLHKRADYILSTARRLVRHHSIAAVAIDGPGHGERRADGGQDADGAVSDFDNTWQRPQASDEIVADWRATLDAVQNLLGVQPVGYFGLSMGTMMGLPLVAAESRIQVAVLGLMGIWGANAKRLQQDAPKVNIPIRFLIQWDDEIVPRDTTLNLFDLIGSSEKTLHGNPGPHQAVPPTEMRTMTEFLATHLTG